LNIITQFGRITTRLSQKSVGRGEIFPTRLDFTNFNSPDCGLVFKWTMADASSVELGDIMFGSFALALFLLLGVSPLFSEPKICSLLIFTS
jgi:hypothetical protein